MFDKRKEPRKKLMAFTPVYTLQPKILLGYLGDLTVSGALVVGERLVEVGNSISLAIEFPDEMTGLVPRPFTILARVARCQKDESPLYFNVGLEFTDVKPEQVALIKMIINRYQFRRDLPI